MSPLIVDIGTRGVEQEPSIYSFLVCNDYDAMGSKWVIDHDGVVTQTLGDEGSVLRNSNTAGIVICIGPSDVCDMVIDVDVGEESFTYFVDKIVDQGTFHRYLLRYVVKIISVIYTHTRSEIYPHMYTYKKKLSPLMHGLRHMSLIQVLQHLLRVQVDRSG